jgi:hypothetical protein
MISRKDLLISLALMGCSLLGIGAGELAWVMIFPSSSNMIDDVIAPLLMAVSGLALLVITNRVYLKTQAQSHINGGSSGQGGSSETT